MKSASFLYGRMGIWVQGCQKIRRDLTFFLDQLQRMTHYKPAVNTPQGSMIPLRTTSPRLAIWA